MLHNMLTWAGWGEGQKLISIPSTRTCRVGNGLRAAPWKRTWRCWCIRRQTWPSTSSPESQPWPSLPQKHRGQQGKGRGSPHLLCSGEPPPAVLHPAPGPPTQEGHGAVGTSAQEGNSDDQTVKTPVLVRLRDMGFNWAWKREGSREVKEHLLLYKGAPQVRWRGTFIKAWSDRKGRVALSWKTACLG